MALPNIMRRLFRNDGYGPLLKAEIIPFASGLDDKSGAAASTEWVKDLAAAAVYVDAASGSDSNGGFSSSEPVKTIGKGIDILSKLPTVQGSFVRLYINSGTYDEDILLEKAKYDISISGNIYINGSIRFSNCFCKITQSVGNSLNISCSNTLFAIHCDNGSNVDISTDINITCNNVNDVVFVGRHSHFNCDGGISISGSAITNGVSLYEYGSAEIQQIQESNGVVNCGLNIKNNSFLFVKGNATLYGLSTIFCDNFSFINIDCDTVSVNHIGANGNAIYAANFSRINILAKTMSISLGGTSVTSAIYAINFSYISTNMSQSYTFSGACDTTVLARAFGFVFFGPASASVSGSVTGKRYATNDHGMIFTGGAGANRIPGTVAGTATSSSFGMYY